LIEIVKMDLKFGYESTAKKRKKGNIQY